VVAEEQKTGPAGAMYPEYLAQGKLWETNVESRKSHEVD
jgi:hypothetical protein